MEEKVITSEATTSLIEACHDQNTKGRRQSHNFSIESILSSASSAFAVATKQENIRPCHLENRLSLHPDILGQKRLTPDQRFHVKNSLENEQTNEELVEPHMEKNKDDEY